MNMAQAFNEWMRRYIEEPERFEREFQTVTRFELDEAVGNEPDYGKSCEGYLRQLMREPREGAIESVIINGRTFPVAYDSGAIIKLGGIITEAHPNPDRTARLVKRRETMSVSGLVLAVDSQRQDLRFLRRIARTSTLVPVCITLTSGTAYMGRGTIEIDIKAKGGKRKSAPRTNDVLVNITGPGALQRTSQRDEVRIDDVAAGMELMANAGFKKRPPPKKVPRPPHPKTVKSRRGKFSVQQIFDAKDRAAEKAKRGGKRRGR